MNTNSYRDFLNLKEIKLETSVTFKKLYISIINLL